MDHPEILLKLSCPDRVGLLAEVTGFCAARSLNLLEAHQFTDNEAGWFFTRLRLQPVGHFAGIKNLHEDLASFASKLEAEWTLRERTTRPRAAILVSREGHCLADLLWRWRSGDLDMDLVGVIGNHRDLEPVARREGVPFVHIPVEPGDRATAFAAIERQLNEWRTEVAVLARFMQIVPPDLCARWAGRMINIHHSFLPAFAGASPYRQAFARGVKLIGATAHFVTEELDAGPIIAQDVTPVDHTFTPERMAQAGRDVEKLVLARAVRLVLEERVFLHGRRTVVFA